MPRAEDGSAVRVETWRAEPGLTWPFSPPPPSPVPLWPLGAPTPVPYTPPGVPPFRARIEPPVPLVPTPVVLGSHTVPFSLPRSSFWPLQATSRGQSQLNYCFSTRKKRSLLTALCVLKLLDSRFVGMTDESHRILNPILWGGRGWM